MTRLNIGCGYRKREGYLNLDQSLACNPDEIFDIEETPWPFASNSVSHIAAIHVLEHIGLTLPTFIRVMKEMYRVLCPGGELEIEVPHPRSDGYLNGIDHVRPITIGGMEQFSKRKCRQYLDRGWPNTPLALEHDIDFDMTLVVNNVNPIWAEKNLPEADLIFCANTYFNVIESIKMTLVKVPHDLSP